jgi:hypothetical protein
LVKNDVPKKANHLQVEAVAATVQRAQTNLRMVDCEEKLFADRRVLGTLLRNLPVAARERWFVRRAWYREPNSRPEEGRIFLAFLEQEQPAAPAALVTAMAIEAGRVYTREAPKNPRAITMAYSKATVSMEGLEWGRKGDRGRLLQELRAGQPVLHPQRRHSRRGRTSRSL